MRRRAPRVKKKDALPEILLSFIKQFYTGTPYIPKELWIQTPIEGGDLIEQWLTRARGGRVHIRYPQKGQKEKLVEMAVQNARIVLERDSDKMKREELRTIGAMGELRDLLGLPELHRVEAYDISNTNGFESVGSMVVYQDGRPKRSDYRKFRIRSVKGPNDYASMREVLQRRFSHGLQELSQGGKEAELTGSFTRFPDLLLMDGGKGQVHIAEEVLRELGLSICVCGMVKDDRHRTRGLYFRDQELPIDPHSEAFRLITRIQDETHRFAIEYHKSLRGKAGVHSVLDDIKGIGPVRRRALMKHFRDLEALKQASVEELSAIPEMDAAAAKSVFLFFREAGEAGEKDGGPGQKAGETGGKAGEAGQEKD